MTKKFLIDDNVYSVLLEYFNGRVDDEEKPLDKKVLSGLKKGRYKKKDVEQIDGKVYTTLRKLLKLQEDNPEKFIEMEWVYPEKK